jgi:Fur family peroxide stress response transcriptional regulator
MMNRERKHSDKRDAILQIIQSTTSHPSAQWVYEKLRPRIPGLSLATVYRNINLFLREGSLISVGVVNGEERFDGIVAPHPHLVCQRCGRVIDLPCPETHIARAANMAIFPEENRDAGPGSGKQSAPPPEAERFTVDYRRTVFYGLCGECRNNEDCSKTSLALEHA